MENEETTLSKLQKILAANLKKIRHRIATAADRVGRDPAEITFLAVTKQVSFRVARLLLDLGIPDLGENRVPSLLAKVEALGSAPPNWHFIGPLQRNKVRRCIHVADWIHSVESERLLNHLDRIAGEENKRPRIFLEVNLTGEKQKHGIAPEGFGYLLEKAQEAENLELVGLMTIGPNTTDKEKIRSAFAKLRGLLFEYCPGLPHLSMGMSNDLEVAIEEGSTIVRVGSALFTGIPTAAEED